MKINDYNYEIGQSPIRLGSDPVQRVYLGDKLIWPQTINLSRSSYQFSFFSTKDTQAIYLGGVYQENSSYGLKPSKTAGSDNFQVSDPRGVAKFELGYPNPIFTIGTSPIYLYVCNPSASDGVVNINGTISRYDAYSELISYGSGVSGDICGDDIGTVYKRVGYIPLFWNNTTWEPPLIYKDTSNNRQDQDPQSYFAMSDNSEVDSRVLLRTSNLTGLCVLSSTPDWSLRTDVSSPNDGLASVDISEYFSKAPGFTISGEDLYVGYISANTTLTLTKPGGTTSCVIGTNARLNNYYLVQGGDLSTVHYLKVLGGNLFVNTSIDQYKNGL